MTVSVKTVVTLAVLAAVLGAAAAVVRANRPRADEEAVIH